MRPRVSVLLLVCGLCACDPPPAAPHAPAARASSEPAPRLADSAASTEGASASTDAGADAAEAATAAAPSGPSPICESLDAASAANPATEQDGITRAVVIESIFTGWGDFEGGMEATSIVPSGFVHTERHAPLSGANTRKNGYYEVTDRVALQKLFDQMASVGAVERIVRSFVGPVTLSMPSFRRTTSVTYAGQTVDVQMEVPELPGRFVGTVEPAAFSRPGIKGHHLADLKVLHAIQTRAIDCIATFDHKQAVLFASQLGKRATSREFVSDAIAQLPRDCADVARTLSSLLVSLPPDVPASPEAPHPADPARVKPTTVVAKLGNVTSVPPVADAERVAAGLLPRFRACYTHGTPDDQKHTGNVRFRINVSPAGEVSSATIADSGGYSNQLTACMRRAVVNSQFAAPGGAGSTVDVPISLAPAQ